MKKLFALLIIFLGLSSVSAEELCNSFYKVNISVEGKGTIKTKLSDKEYTKDSTINVKCADNFLFEANPEDGYVLNGVYINGNHITSDNNKVYGIYDIDSNSNVKIVFKQAVDEKENVIDFTSYEDNISLYIADLKEEVKDNTVLSIALREVTILLDKEFVNNSEDNITIVAGQIYKEDINYKQQKAAKASLYYNFSIYNGDKAIDDFKGKATYVIPYSKSKKAFVYLVGKEGKLTLIKSTYDNEKVSFDLNKTGTYAISSEELNQMGYIKNILSLNNKRIMALVGIGFALGLLIVLLIIKRRK